MFVQVRQAKTQGAKKKKVSASHKPSALFLPPPPKSPLIPLFFLHPFFYDLSLFCLWTIQAGSHVAGLTPALTLSKVGRLCKRKRKKMIQKGKKKQNV